MPKTNSTLKKDDYDNNSESNIGLNPIGAGLSSTPINGSQNDSSVTGDSYRNRSGGGGEQSSYESTQFSRSTVTTSQPSRINGTQPASGYIIFGGKVQIFDDDWKEREPMTGQFENDLLDVCWDRRDCLLAFLLPCIYKCLLVTGITKRPGLGCLIYFFPWGMCCVRQYVRKVRKIQGNKCHDCLTATFCPCCVSIQIKREVLDFKPQTTPTIITNFSPFSSSQKD